MSLGREIEEAQRVYKDILNGYSSVKIDDKDFFIKHLSDLDHGWIQEYKKLCFNDAKEKGVLTEQEKIESLIEQELWSDKKQERIAYLRDEISNLTTTLRKLILKKQKAQIEKEIDTLQDELINLLEEKAELMGITCESHAEKKVNERYVYYCLFKDGDFKERYLTEEEFEEIDSITLTKLITINNNKLSELNSDNIDKIAACPFFLNSLMLCKSNPFTFFGKPVIELTNFQQMLFSAGTRYRSIIENSGKVPPDTTSLENMVNWYNNTAPTSGGTSSSKEEGGTAGETVFGADKEELKALTNKNNDGRTVKNLTSEANKLLKEKENDKGYLDMNDMLKLHGEI